MRFTVRRKLVVAFVALVVPILAVVAVVAAYNQRELFRGMEKTEIFMRKMAAAGNLEHLLDRVVMPANDYIITEDEKYALEFEKMSGKMEAALAEAHDVLTQIDDLNIKDVTGERETLDSVTEAWSNVNDISGRIFALPDPMGDARAAALMEEMDYKWARPSVVMLEAWHDRTVVELKAAALEMDSAWERSWKIMGVAFVVMALGAAYLTVFISRLIVRPIIRLHRGAEAIASGDLSMRTDIRTGDEMEQLSGAFNGMAERLSESYSVLEDRVEERTVELRRERDRLIESEERFSSFFENDPSYCYMISTSGNIIDVNRAVLKALGYERDELVGRPLKTIYAPESRTRMKECFEKWKRTGELKDEELEVITKGGTRRTVLLSAGAVRDANNELLHSISVQQDITERKRAEEALSESEERMRSVSDTALDAVIMIDNDANVLYWNHAAERTFGYTPEEALGASLPELVVPERYREKLGQGFARFRETGQGPLVGKTVEAIAKRKDGAEFTIEHALSAIMVKGKWCAVGIMRDITERKKAEEGLKRQADITRDLLKISEAAIRVTDMGRLMSEVTASVARITEADLCLFYLWEHESMSFRPSKASGLAHEQVPAFRTGSISLDVGFVKKAVESGEVYLASLGGPGEVEEEGVFDWIRPMGALSVIPLLGRRAYLGLLVCVCATDNRRSTAGFTVRDRELLQGIGHQVSTSLEEARLHQDSINKAMELSHKIETIQAMYEIDKSILSTQDPQEIIEVAVNMVSRLAPCDAASVSLLDGDSNRFLIKAGFGMTVKVEDGPTVDPSASEAVKTLRPVYTSDVHALENTDGICKTVPECRSRLVLPLTIKDKAVGVLSACSRRPSAFTPEDLSTLEKLAAQIGVALENSRLVENMRELFIGTIKALSGTIDAKSPWTRGHSERVTKIALDIAKEMGMKEEELKRFEIAGLLHDIGKIGTLETILDKPGKLTDEEKQILMKHPGLGAEILSPIKPLANALPIIRHHHEHYDGNGYPDGLKGDAIPLCARILAVADTVDAMCSDRPYRKGLAMEKIVDELKKCSSTQFDPMVVEAYLKSAGIPSDRLSGSNS